MESTRQNIRNLYRSLMHLTKGMEELKTDEIQIHFVVNDIRRLTVNRCLEYGELVTMTANIAREIGVAQSDVIMTCNLKENKKMNTGRVADDIIFNRKVTAEIDEDELIELDKFCKAKSVKHRIVYEWDEGAMISIRAGDLTDFQLWLSGDKGEDEKEYYKTERRLDDACTSP